MSMTYVNLDVANRNDQLRSEIRIARRIGVSINCLHRRDESKLIENVGATYVPCVKYEAHTLESFVYRWSEKSVRVADESHYDSV